MGDGAKALRWSLALGGAALSANALREWLLWRGGASRRFVYVTPTTGTGEETLWLSEIARPSPKTKTVARTIKSLFSVPGEQPSGGVPESFHALVPSPGNRRMAVLSVQLGSDFVDNNVRIVDMEAGKPGGFFNEHRFSTISRATCTSALFDAHLAAEAAVGVPADVLAGYDWRVVLEGQPGANIPSPELRWADDETLVVGFRLPVVTIQGQELGEELFRFRIAADGGSDSFEQWTGPAPAPPLTGPLSIASPSAAKAYAILYNGSPLRFLRRAPVLAPPAWLIPQRKAARMVAGLIA
ncbi:hypothetical protein [Sphingomonas sp.]|jgi:hypothetical protein|uniref:hypothetical protein n=1 Tax=Sphingomonas sp. TaxID=28214 RepID=UPI002DE6B572|nr:hypothetical protein [Sphingomonas sp.]